MQSSAETPRGAHDTLSCFYYDGDHELKIRVWISSADEAMRKAGRNIVCTTGKQRFTRFSQHEQDSLEQWRTVQRCGECGIGRDRGG